MIQGSLIRTLALARKLGREELVSDFPEIIERLKQAGIRKWFDREKGFFVDNGQISWAAQIWAAYGEMLPPEETRQMLLRVMKDDSALRPGGPYLHNQMVIVLEKYGLHGEARRLIRDYWGAMLDFGATTFWEDFDLTWTENAFGIDQLPVPGKKDIHGDFGKHCYIGLRHSLCHGWAGGPTAFLSDAVLGVKILKPGYREVSVQPDLCGLEYVRGSVPTPFGPIEVTAEKNGKTKINVPDGITLKE